MDGLIGIGFMIGFIGIIVVGAFLTVEIANWNYDRLQKKFHKNCPLYQKMYDEYWTLYEEWCHYDSEIEKIEKEIASLSKELDLCPYGLKDRYWRKIDNLKQIRFDYKIKSEKIVKELKSIKNNIYNYLIEKNYTDRAKEWDYK